MGAFMVAAVAAIGNLLQGWDGGAIAGALLYLKPEFHLEEAPALEGEVVASTLVGAVAAVCIAGPSADWLGRKFMLCVSGVLYAIAALVMVWAPSVYVLIVGRLLVGSAIGLAATIAPILISESAPSEIRGQLATFPQFLGSAGLFLAYVMDFVLSLQPTVNWRFMLGFLFIPSLFYVILGLSALPESPRWLVSKGRMNEAKKVLQNIRGQDDVDGEMALLVEGLGAGGETHMEEWLLNPAERPVKDDDEESVIEEGQIKLFGPDDTTWIATPIVDEYGHSMANALSRSAMTDSRVSQFLDPVVTMMGSVQNSFQDMGLMSHDPYEDERWDEEAQTPRQQGSDDLETSLLSKQYGSGLSLPPMSRNNSARGQGYTRSDSQSRNRSPLSRQQSRSRSRRAHSRSGSRGFGFSGHSRSYSKSMAPDGIMPDMASSVGVGGGWQLAWRWDEGGKDGEDAGLKRVFLKNDGGEMSQYQSTMSLPGIEPQNVDESFQAAVIVGQSTQFSKELMEEHPVGPAMMHPAETATRVPPMGNLWDHGVKRALFVGVCLQILQQFSGINAVLYFTPQILMQSGAGDILGKLGLDAQSSSILASGVTCFLMLPCIFLAMKLMDVSGRRGLLLTTIPALTVSLVSLVVVNLFNASGLIPALISFFCVTVFICSFVAGFGPIPNILCSEIFPTRVRGTCIGICAGAMWSSNVIMTYSFPLLNNSFGLQGVFGFFAVVTFVAWIFVFIYVPETKGQPLEVICEIFAMAARREQEIPEDAY